MFDRCKLNKCCICIKNRLGALKWPLKEGSHLIEVARTAGLTVHELNQFLKPLCKPLFFQ